jgi:uncharacterized delta-60 repeat protein
MLVKNYFLISAFFLFVCPILGFAQPGSLDLSFDPFSGADSDIMDIKVDANGGMYIVGAFTYFDTTYSPKIAKLHNDGSYDTSFHCGSGLDGLVRKITIQADGKLLLAGDFNFYNAYPSKGLVRIFPNGDIDTSFYVGNGINDYGKALAIQSDQRILLGGNFTTYNGIPVTRLVRLFQDGSLDSTFNFSNGPNGTVEEILIQPDGKIVVGGDFTQIGQSFRLRVARLNANGSLDPSFGNGLGLSAVVFAMDLYSNNRLLVGGNFTSYNLQTSGRVARLNGDGNLDNAFPVGSGANSYVHDIKVQNDNSILIAGGFSSFRANPFPYLVKTDSSCTEDYNFNSGSIGPDETINSIALQPDGKILIGGAFNHYNGISRNRIARLYSCLTPQPSSILGPDYILCSGTYTFSVPPVAEAQSYQWILPSGWTGSSDSSAITVVANGSGTITVKAFSDSCGYSYATIKEITQTQIPAPEICLVTVDSASTHTIILWEKNPPTTLIDSFFIYREISTNNYVHIASVAYDSLSEYHDWSANPNVTNYRYRISALDLCGQETEPSPYHSTIHLQDQFNGNFNWTFYQIENQANPVVNYKFYKADQNSSSFQQIGFISGNSNQFTDLNYSQFDSSSYVVDVEWAIGCEPTRTVNTTRSNIRHKYVVNAIDRNSENRLFEVFPNPANSKLFIRVNELKSIHLFNATGQEVRKVEKASKDLIELSIEELPKGLYNIQFYTGKGQLSKKIILD